MKKNTTIIGAGLVGSLLSIYLAKRGHKVSIYERRDDMRKAKLTAGRSINLALSDRGLLALEKIGLADEIKKNFYTNALSFYTQYRWHNCYTTLWQRRTIY